MSGCSIELCNGIAKDKPCLPNHFPARNFATDATSNYVIQIFSDPRMRGNAQAIKALMGIKGTLGFVIDDTGSMGTELNRVKSRTTSIVNSVRDTEEEPEQYLLVRFGEDVGNAFVTDDADAFLAAVNSLSPGGGGDCPEFAMSAQIRAIAASRSDSTIYTFSDAAPKDAKQSGNVKAQANNKRIQMTEFLTGTCSPIDPAFIQVAEETGGQLFFLSPFELDQVLDLVRPQLEGNFVTVSTIRSNVPTGLHSFPIPIDSTMSRAIFSVSSLDSNISVNLIKPSGSIVDPNTDPDATLADINSAWIMTIQNPESGSWRLEIQSEGDLSIDVKANSPLNIGRFDFVRLIINAHGGYFPIEGQPIAGEEQIGLARIFGPYASANFKLIDDAGQTIQALNFSSDLLSGPGELVGRFVPPQGKFRIAISGLDEAGFPYQRTLPRKFLAQKLQLSLDPKSIPSSITAGQTATIKLELTNNGESDSFNIVAADERNFISRVSPALINLGNNETANIEIDVTVPTSITEAMVLTVSVTATSSTNPEIENSIVIPLQVDSNRPPDCSTADGFTLNLWPPNHKLESIDILKSTNISDPDGDSVSIRVDDITQDEPVNGLGSGDTSPDGFGIGSDVAKIRAERSGKGNGRVYEIIFTASDDRGGSCESSINVSVPKNKQGSLAIDDGQIYDSTQQ